LNNKHQHSNDSNGFQFTLPVDDASDAKAPRIFLRRDLQLPEPRAV